MLLDEFVSNPKLTLQQLVSVGLDKQCPESFCIRAYVVIDQIASRLVRAQQASLVRRIFLAWVVNEF